MNAKKNRKKLALSRENVRNLSSRDLAEAIGGVSYNSRCSPCPTVESCIDICVSVY